jgi:HD superfamily phosphodiesterase
VTEWREALTRENKLRQAVTAALAAQKKGEQESAARLAAAVRVYGDPQTLHALAGVPVEASRAAMRAADPARLEQLLANLEQRANRRPSERKRGRQETRGAADPADLGHDEQPQAGDRPGAVV